MGEQETNSYIIKRIFLGALDTALLIVAAFVFYKVIGEYKNNIIKFIPLGQKYHIIIIIILHILFIFLFDLFLRFIFAFAFGIPI